MSGLTDWFIVGLEACERLGLFVGPNILYTLEKLPYYNTTTTTIRPVQT
jgi:hypothetical protein